MKLEKLIDRNASEALPIDELKNLSFEDQAKLIEYVFTFSSITHFFKDQIDPELIQYTPFYTIFDLNSSNLSSYQPFSFVENEKNGLLNMTNSNIFSNALLNVRDYLDILNKKQFLEYKDSVIGSGNFEADFIESLSYTKEQAQIYTDSVISNIFNEAIENKSNYYGKLIFTALNDGYKILKGYYDKDILDRQLAFMQTVNPEFEKTENKFRLNEILLKQQIVKSEQLQLGKWGLAPGKKAVDDLPSNAVSISFNLDAIKYYQNIAKQILENKPIETDGSDPAVCCINFNDTNFALIKLGKCFDSEKFNKYSKLNLFCDFDYDSEYDLKLKIWKGIANIKNSSSFSILDDSLMVYDDPEYLQVIAFGDTSSFAEEIKQLCIGKLKELGFVYDERVPANNLAIVLDTSDIDNIEKFSLTNEQFDDDDLFEPDYSISYIPESEDDLILVEASCEDPTLQKTSGHYKKIDRIWVVPKSDFNDKNTELLDYVCYNSMDDVLACTPMKKSELGKIFMSNQQEEPKKAKNINIHVSSSHSHG